MPEGFTQQLLPPTPLELELCAIADTFLTEEPDFAGLLRLAGALADRAELVPESLVVAARGSTGKLQWGGNLTGSFSVADDVHRIDMVVWDDRAGLRRSLELTFDAEDEAARRGKVRVGSIPDNRKTAHTENLGGTELVGWRAEVDPLDGARVMRTSTRVDDPASDFPAGAVVADHYLFYTHDVEGLEPRAMPALANSDAFDRWLLRVRALRER